MRKKLSSAEPNDVEAAGSTWVPVLMALVVGERPRPGDVCCVVCVAAAGTAAAAAVLGAAGAAAGLREPQVAARAPHLGRAPHRGRSVAGCAAGCAAGGDV